MIDLVPLLCIGCGSLVGPSVGECKDVCVALILTSDKQALSEVTKAWGRRRPLLMGGARWCFSAYSVAGSAVLSTRRL